MKAFTTLKITYDFDGYDSENEGNLTQPAL